MSEQLTDSNILCSRKTYGKKKDHGNLSISNEKGESFSATVSKQLKNSCTSLLSNYSEKLYAEKNFESVTSAIMSNHCGNISIQTGAVNSEVNLFNDDDIDYYFPDSIDSKKDHDSLPSTTKISSSGSKYQRTRKNLKNRLNNRPHSSELTAHEKYSKSAHNFLHLTQALPTNSIVSVDNQVEHTKNSIKAIDAGVKKLPQNPILSQTSNKAGMLSGIGSMLPNSSKSSSDDFSLINLVKKFAKSSNKTTTKEGSCNKRKRTQKECESVSPKKASVAKNMVSTKVSSVEKKISNSVISIGNYSEGANLKSDIITRFQDIQKAHNVKSSLKSSKHHLSPKKANKASVGNMKKNVVTPKTVQKGSNTSDNGTEKSIQMLQKYVSNNKTFKNYATSKLKCPTSSSLATSGFNLTRNEIAEKILSDKGDKQIESPFVQSKECTVQDQALATIPEENIALHCGPIMPTIIAPLPPISQENPMTPLRLWVLPSIANNIIQNNNHAVSYEDIRDLSIPGPSTLSNGDFSEKTSNYYLKNMRAEETTTTTTIINRTDIGCYQQKSFFRPRTHINDGIDFHRYMANSLKTFENNSILKCKEESNEFFSMNPSLLNITVKEFFDNPSLTDVLLDYVNGLDMSKPLDVPNPNKGYDFPENFENEDLLGVVKDFVHTAISYMIPSNAPKPVLISYSRIIKAAMLKMSSREFIVITQMFKKTDQLFKLKDVCARLSLVALFVIFDEYKNGKRKCR